MFVNDQILGDIMLNLLKSDLKNLAFLNNKNILRVLYNPIFVEEYEKYYGILDMLKFSETNSYEDILKYIDEHEFDNKTLKEYCKYYHISLVSSSKDIIIRNVLYALSERYIEKCFTRLLIKTSLRLAGINSPSSIAELNRIVRNPNFNPNIPYIYGNSPNTRAKIWCELFGFSKDSSFIQYLIDNNLININDYVYIEEDRKIDILYYIINIYANGHGNRTGITGDDLNIIADKINFLLNNGFNSNLINKDRLKTNIINGVILKNKPAFKQYLINIVDNL